MIATGLAFALGTLAPIPLQAVARDPAEPVIVEIALGRLTSRTVTSYRIGNDALLPVAVILDLAEIRILSSAPGRLVASIEPAGTRLVVDAAQHRLEIGTRSRPLEERETLVRDGEVFLATTALGQALGVEWAVSWADLSITAVDPAALPIALRIGRDWRRRVEDGIATPGLDIVSLGPGPRRRVDGMVLDYSLSTPSGQPLSRAAYSAGVGLDLFGGSFTATAQNQTEGSGTRIRSDVAWAGYWRERTWLTQARIGDGYATGPRPRSVRGFSIGNAPLQRPNEIGEVAFTGALGPGWQVEAYRGGRRIGFDSVNAFGKYSIDAPVAYGENPVEFIAYGPFGEIRRFNRAYRVDANRIATRRLEYGLSVGGCRTDRCDATLNADVRYGISPRWTARAGVDQFWRNDSLGNLSHPYAGAYGSVGNDFGVQAEIVADAIARAAVRYQPSPDLAIGVEATRFARGVRAPLLTVAGRTSQYTVTGFYRPLGRLAAFFVDASLDVARSTTGTATGGRLGFSYQLDQVQLLPGIRWQRSTAAGLSSGRTTLELNTVVLPIQRLGPVLGQVTGRSFFETTGGLDPVSISGYLSRNLGREWRLELGGGWSDFQGSSLSINLAANLSTIRGLASLTRTRTGTVASQYIQGSVLYDRANRDVHFAAGPSLERAGIAGRVFLDANGNDRFDPGEEPLPNVRVSVGLETRFSDAEGTFRLWNLAPYEPTVIAVDSATLSSPLWVPARGVVSIEPGPNRYQVVDIPIAPGGVIDGRTVRAADSTGVAGVTLVLVNLDSGARRTVTTFSDGEFYAMGIKPGRYRLELDPRVVERLSWTAEPIEFTLAADAEGATVAGLVVRIR